MRDFGINKNKFCFMNKVDQMEWRTWCIFMAILYSFAIFILMSYLFGAYFFV